MSNKVLIIGLGLAMSGFLGCASSHTREEDGSFPKSFVYLQDIDSSIIQEMRYRGDHNFIGRPVMGYESPKCILTKETALALKAVQDELKNYSMSLKVYDCYRPQRAVNHFVEWAKDLNDDHMKKEFYPKVEKAHLFKDGYISEKSGHSRGSTVDLTLVPLPVPKQDDYRNGMKLVQCDSPVEKRFKDNSLDFGTGYDCFDPLSHTANPSIGSHQKRNRLLLKSIMEKNGFKNLDVEWWHYTLRNEPFPNTYFDFLVK